MKYIFALVFAILVLIFVLSSDRSAFAEASKFDRVYDVDIVNAKEWIIVHKGHQFEILDSDLNLLLEHDFKQYVEYHGMSKNGNLLFQSYSTQYSFSIETLKLTLRKLPDHIRKVQRYYGHGKYKYETVNDALFSNMYFQDNDKLYYGWNFSTQDSDLKLDSTAIDAVTSSEDEPFLAIIGKLNKLEYFIRLSQKCNLNVKEYMSFSTYLYSRVFHPFISSNLNGFVYLDGDILGPNIFDLNTKCLKKLRNVPLEPTAVTPIRGAGNQGYWGIFDQFNLVIYDSKLKNDETIIDDFVSQNKPLKIYRVVYSETLDVFLVNWLAEDGYEYVSTVSDSKVVNKRGGLLSSSISSVSHEFVETSKGRIGVWVYNPKMEQLAGVIYYIHGGPFSNAHHEFELFENWLSQGFVVIAPNYAGSVGYGARYSADIGKLGIDGIGTQLAEVVDEYSNEFGEVFTGIVGVSFGGVIAQSLLKTEKNRKYFDFLWFESPILNPCNHYDKVLASIQKRSTVSKPTGTRWVFDVFERCVQEKHEKVIHLSDMKLSQPIVLIADRADPVVDFSKNISLFIQKPRMNQCSKNYVDNNGEHGVDKLIALRRIQKLLNCVEVENRDVP